jgi:hypothetical protein
VGRVPPSRRHMEASLAFWLSGSIFLLRSASFSVSTRLVHPYTTPPPALYCPHEQRREGKIRYDRTRAAKRTKQATREKGRRQRGDRERETERERRRQRGEKAQRIPRRDCTAHIASTKRNHAPPPCTAVRPSLTYRSEQTTPDRYSAPRRGCRRRRGTAAALQMSSLDSSALSTH